MKLRDLSTAATLPTPFLVEILPLLIVAIPTLSYPLYSIRLRLSTKTGATFKLPVYPIIEHTNVNGCEGF